MYGTAGRTWPVQSRRHKDTTAGRQHAEPYIQALYEFRRAFKDAMGRDPDCAPRNAETLAKSVAELGLSVRLFTLIWLVAFRQRGAREEPVLAWLIGAV